MQAHGYCHHGISKTAVCCIQIDACGYTMFCFEMALQQ